MGALIYLVLAKQVLNYWMDSKETFRKKSADLQHIQFWSYPIQDGHHCKAILKDEEMVTAQSV